MVSTAFLAPVEVQVGVHHVTDRLVLWAMTVVGSKTPEATGSTSGRVTERWSQLPILHRLHTPLPDLRRAHFPPTRTVRFAPRIWAAERTISSENASARREHDGGTRQSGLPTDESRQAPGPEPGVSVLQRCRNRPRRGRPACGWDPRCRPSRNRLSGTGRFRRRPSCRGFLRPHRSRP